MNTSIKATLLSAIVMFGIVSPGSAQKKAGPKKATPAKKAAAAPAGKATKMAGGFMKLPSGLEYKIARHGTGKKKPAMNDHIEMIIHVHVADSVMFDSRKMNNNKPVPFPIGAPKFKGDPVEGFMLMVVGDSAIFRLPVDSMKKAGNQLLPWMKEGMKIEYDVVLVSVKTDAEEKRDNEQKSAIQKAIDDVNIQDYFKKNNIKATKTASGLYYTVSQEGLGEKVQAGQTASVNYTGKLLNGTTFDSNTDTSFKHPEPFKVEVGKGRVIKGWDEGLQLMKKGTRAKLYIPSGLAYGSQDRSPIPANSVLIFDIEVLDILTAEQLKKETEAKAEARKKEMEARGAKQKALDDSQLREYFSKNNIHATKTESGLYYTINREGTGETAKAGQKVSMNYIGKLLNGKVFDGNVDSNMVPVPGKSAFSFALGQHQVIAGWDEGVQLLKKGTRATFYIPSTLGYGERGAGGAIPPNAPLIFDVELLDMEK